MIYTSELPTENYGTITHFLLNKYFVPDASNCKMRDRFIGKLVSSVIQVAL